MEKFVVGFFGDGPWAHQAFDKLIQDSTIQIAFVCARFDATDLILKQKALTHDIPFFIHNDINSEDFFAQVAFSKYDLFVSMSFNQIFKKKLINLPRLKSINCHAGKLPYYRGRNILNWVLINDESEFGITVHFMDEKIDTGDILVQTTLQITDKDDYSTLLSRAYPVCAELLYYAIKGLQQGDMSSTPQSTIDKLGMYCTARKIGDEKLSWNQTSRDVFNFVRALCKPGPQARTFYGAHEIYLNRVEYLPNAPKFKGIPGAVLDIENTTLIVKTEDSYIKIIEWNGIENIKIGMRLK